jgi:DMSO/TMAO reductase YedYZ molybdopterin-dependent catalytic subunit
MLGRREVLHIFGASALGAVGAVATRASRARAADAGDSGSFLQMVGGPQDLATPTEYFDRLVTPNDVFFVRSHFGPPALRADRRLRMTGEVTKALDLAPDDLKAFPEVTVTAVLQCAGNGRALHQPRVPGVQWVHGAMGQAAWTGVRLKDLLDKAGVRCGAGHVHLVGADLPFKPQTPAFIRSIPLARALDPSTIVAYRMNGAPLSHAHGAPLRLVVPGWAGDHWMKWLTELRVQPEPATGFFMDKGYRMPTEPVPPGSVVPPEKMAPATYFPVKSIIARPAPNGVAKVGPQEIIGVAFAGDAAIQKVEVSVDGLKTWKTAALTGAPGPGRWQVFRHTFKADVPGHYHAVVRATDARGRIQPEMAAWNPSGYFWNGWHSVDWQVMP